MKEIIKKIVRGNNLCLEEAIQTAEYILSENNDPIQVAAILTGLSVKGYALEEITGFVLCGRKYTRQLDIFAEHLIDIVGTGSDGSNTFNISTAASFVVAGADVSVAKYGNRAISSNSGSSDVLEHLGINIIKDDHILKKCFEETGLVFMNAQKFNISFKYAALVRKKIGIPTIFNLIGPLTNPANPHHILMGVYDPNLIQVIAESANNIGYKRGLFVNGNGLDEITTTGMTQVSELNNNIIKNYFLDPSSFGFEYGSLEYLQVKSKEESASAILNLLNGYKSESIDQMRRDIVVLNSAAALYIAEKVSDIKSGIKLAEESIDSGKALEKLYTVRRIMNQDGNKL